MKETSDLVLGGAAILASAAALAMSIHEHDIGGIILAGSLVLMCVHTVWKTVRKLRKKKTGL